MHDDDEIVARCESGESMASIGSSLGVTRERIRQRLKRNGCSGRNSNGLPTTAKLLDAVQRALSFSSLANELGLTRRKLHEAIAFRNVQSQVAEALAANQLKAAAEQRLAAQRPYVVKIREIARQVRRTPTTGDLGPHAVYHVTLNNLFGSVANAMLAAGLRPNDVGRAPHPLPADFDEEFAPTADIALLEEKAAQIRRNGAVERPNGNESPVKLSIASSAFVRDPAVVAWIRDQAHGVCEACGEPGYEMDDGSIFLEVHHVYPLADGGPDVVSNAAAVCETCHGKLHRWKERAEMKADLLAQLPRLLDWAVVHDL